MYGTNKLGGEANKVGLPAGLEALFCSRLHNSVLTSVSAGRRRVSDLTLLGRFLS